MVKYSIFYRINTGGLVLNPQEIRHALNQEGHAADYLKEVSGIPTFKKIVNVSSRRMQDRELILRHLAFRLHPYDTYKPTMKRFLNETMEELNELPKEKLEILKHQFISSLEASEHLFGKHVFSKSLANPSTSPTLNRGLFEVLTVLLAEMPDARKKQLISHKEEFLKDFIGLLKDRDFDRHITSAKTESIAVKERFNKINKLISKFIRR